jgi:hypothetical protein
MHHSVLEAHGPVGCVANNEKIPSSAGFDNFILKGYRSSIQQPTASWEFNHNRPYFTPKDRLQRQRFSTTLFLIGNMEHPNFKNRIRSHVGSESARKTTTTSTSAHRHADTPDSCASHPASLTLRFPFPASLPLQPPLQRTRSCSPQKRQCNQHGTRGCS